MLEQSHYFCNTLRDKFVDGAIKFSEQNTFWCGSAIPTGFLVSFIPASDLKEGGGCVGVFSNDFLNNLMECQPYIQISNKKQEIPLRFL